LDYVDSEASRVFVSSLTLVELTSVAAIKVGTGAIGEPEAAAALRQVSVSIAVGHFAVLRLDDQQLQAASSLLTRHARSNSLRTLDALHLASAIRRKNGGGVDYFVTADGTLAKVAILEGLAVLNPEVSPRQ